MLNGAGLSIVAASKSTAASDVLGQLATLFVMGLAAAEATLVLAMILVVHRRFGKVVTEEISLLK
jgi:NADH-quinone oxidoreductase subunit K